MTFRIYYSFRISSLTNKCGNGSDYCAVTEIVNFCFQKSKGQSFREIISYLPDKTLSKGGKTGPYLLTFSDNRQAKGCKWQKVVFEKIKSKRKIIGSCLSGIIVYVIILEQYAYTSLLIKRLVY